ncbi:hypothetical protein QCE73_02090 [Caballeronia sp. LZ029]|uniref:hypothetical protein n=1 Tax=Caballeronia sp. LZ029 TaxID=3038564 RepID=UPI00285F6259|nr:hypothetical protein [Caballeronia sp. LZ029]MDR5741942.1 hypothetical protein [Caballeronia sp. LZ029]
MANDVLEDEIVILLARRDVRRSDDSRFGIDFFMREEHDIAELAMSARNLQRTRRQPGIERVHGTYRHVAQIGSGVAIHCTSLFSDGCLSCFHAAMHAADVRRIAVRLAESAKVCGLSGKGNND